MDNELVVALVSLKDAVADSVAAVDFLYGDGSRRSIMKDSTRHLTSEIFEITRGVDRVKKAFDEVLVECRQVDEDCEAVRCFAVEAAMGDEPEDEGGHADVNDPPELVEIPPLPKLRRMNKAELAALCIDLGIAQDIKPGTVKQGLLNLIEFCRTTREQTEED